MGNTSFTIEEVRILSDIIKCIYDPALTLSEFTEVFMAKLKSLIYFDKSDFMKKRYNNDTKKDELESFRPVNRSPEEINNYVTTYMHNDDVLPILSQRQCIAFRNSDLFSMRERRETKYFQEFASGASLEISIDANIPLPEDCDTIAILGLFRTNEKVEFREKDLEIVKCLQPYLSDRMKEEFCPDSKQAALTVPEKTSSESGQEESWMLDNIETLGLCSYDASANMLSNNASFSAFAKAYHPSIKDSIFTRKITSCVKKLLQDTSLCTLGPIPIHIEDDTYMVQLAYNDSTHTKITAAVYYISDVFTKRLTALKEEFSLSNREFEIIFLSLKRSLTNSEIAKELYISEATVKRHIYTVYQKMGISNQKQLFRKLQIL